MEVLIIDSYPDPWLSEMQALPVKVNYFPNADRELALALLATANILVLNSKIKVDREAIDHAPHLQMVIRAGVGMDHIDQEYLREKGIRAEFTAGANADSVGEQTVGMLLTLRHHLMSADREVRQFFWRRESNRGSEIGGKTIGIIGYGHTGQAVARRLSGFGMKVLAYDKYRKGFSDQYVKEATMEQIYQEATIITFHVPLTAETRRMANDAFFTRFRHPITLLNLARGPIVELPALLRAIDHGQVVAAALDVLPNEKLDTLSSEERIAYKNLFSRNEVLLSPHIGGWSHESLDNINRRILAYVEEMLPEQKHFPEVLKVDLSDEAQDMPTAS